MLRRTGHYTHRAPIAKAWRQGYHCRVSPSINQSTYESSTTLDPGSDVHISNNPAKFQWKARAAPDDIVLAGGSESAIEAWGEVTISLSTQHGIRRTQLEAAIG
jgi:hypothetical protein